MFLDLYRTHRCTERTAIGELNGPAENQTKNLLAVRKQCQLPHHHAAQDSIIQRKLYISVSAVRRNFRPDTLVKESNL